MCAGATYIQRLEPTKAQARALLQLALQYTEPTVAPPSRASFCLVPQAQRLSHAVRKARPATGRPLLVLL